MILGFSHVLTYFCIWNVKLMFVAWFQIIEQ